MTQLKAVAESGTAGCNASNKPASYLASLWRGCFYWLWFHGGNWLLSTANQAPREDKMDAVICTGVAIEHDQTTPSMEGEGGGDE